MGSLYGKNLYGLGLYSLAPNVDLAGSLAVVPALAANLGEIAQVTGTLAVTPAFGGALSQVFDIVGGLAPNIVMAGTFSNPVDLREDLTLVIGLANSAMQLVTGLSGDLGVDPVFDADLDMLTGIAGSWTVGVTINSAELIAGPFWGEVDSCDAVWVELEPC